MHVKLAASYLLPKGSDEQERVTSFIIFMDKAVRGNASSREAAILAGVVEAVFTISSQNSTPALWIPSYFLLSILKTHPEGLLRYKALLRSLMMARRTYPGLIGTLHQPAVQHEGIQFQNSVALVRRTQSDAAVLGKTLEESLRDASVMITTAYANGELFVWGYVPIVLAKWYLCNT
jgi:hypothetical protein